MKSSSIFWSIFLISIGVVFLLIEFDAFPYELDFVFNLWPVVFVLWGLALFKIPEILKKILVGGSGFVAALFIMAVVTHDYNPGCEDNIHVSFDRPHDDYDDYDDLDTLNDNIEQNKFSTDFDHPIKSGLFTMHAGAGKFIIRGNSEFLINGSSKHVTTDISSYLDENDTSRAIVNLDMAFGTMSKKKKNSSSIKLSSSTQWDMKLNMGAGKFYGDFRVIRARNINFEAGAADVELILGLKENEVDLDLGVGMAKVLIRVPKEAGCKITEGDDFFVSKYFEGFESVGDKHITANYDTSDVKININLSGGMAKFEVVRY
jgi:hypothetical protein